MNNVGGLSDLGRLQAMQSRTVSVQKAMDDAGTEMTTGRKNDLYEATGGNLTQLYAIERSLARNEAYSNAAALTDMRLEVMQNAITGIFEPADQLSMEMLIAVNGGAYAESLLHAGVARVDFVDTVNLLNSHVSDQSLFAGTATDSPALAAADDILADLDALVAAETTAAGVITAIETYFAKLPPGAFHTTGYLGTTDDLPPAEVGEGHRVDYAVRADDDRTIAMLQAQALAAVIAGGALPGNEVERMLVLSESGDQMLAAKEGLLDLKTAMGAHQEEVDQARAALVSANDSLSLARQNVLEADIAEAASYFQAIEAQLQAMYTVTARLSNLSFTNFIR